MPINIDQLSLTTNTRLYPLIGYPMGQSTAAFAYNPLFTACGIDEIMWPVEIPVGGLGEFMAAAKTLGMRHFGLTMPHKAAIIPYLDEVEEESRLFNSVNTVKFENGRSIGIGLDGKGNMAAIKAAGVDMRGMHVLMLGAGSIVGCILLQLSRAGAKKVTIINRSMDKAAALADKVAPHIDLELECLSFTSDNLDSRAAACDFLMQSTPLGMINCPAFEYLGFVDKLRPDAVVMENIVNPPLTPLARRARDRGLKVIYGVDMMLGQLGEIFNFCFGVRPKPEHIEAAKKSIYACFDFK